MTIVGTAIICEGYASFFFLFSSLCVLGDGATAVHGKCQSP